MSGGASPGRPTRASMNVRVSRKDSRERARRAGRPGRRFRGRRQDSFEGGGNARTNGTNPRARRYLRLHQLEPYDARAEILPVGPGFAIAFRKTTPAVQRRKNYRRRSSSLREFGRRRYFEDAARQALSKGDKPAERLRDYFRKVVAMEHVVGREYAYVGATAWNRRAFIVAFRECVEPLLDVDVTVADFHQLLILLCPDFPRQTLDAIVHVLPRALSVDGQFSCGTLATAFEVHWSARAARAIRGRRSRGAAVVDVPSMNRGDAAAGDVDVP